MRPAKLIPDHCSRPDCAAPAETWCLHCSAWLCLPHTELPDGHTCRPAMRFNTRLLDADEQAAALEHGIRPLP